MIKIVKRKQRKGAADKPAMRYARILSAIDRAAREQARAEERLRDLRARSKVYERRLGPERVDEIKARFLSNRSLRKQAATTKRDALKTLGAAAELAYRLASMGDRPGIVHAQTYRFGRTRKYHGFMARLPQDKFLLWHPVKGYGSTDQNTGIGNAVWHGKTLPT